MHNVQSPDDTDPGIEREIIAKGLTAPRVPKSAARPTVRPPLPQGQVDQLTLCDLNDIKAIVRLGASFIHGGVRAGTFPAPVIRQPRCTRWLLSDVQRWIAQQIAKATEDTKLSEVSATKARKASAKAREARAVKAEAVELASTKVLPSTRERHAVNPGYALRDKLAAAATPTTTGAPP